MKRILIGLVAVGALLAAAGCSSSCKSACKHIFTDCKQGTASDEAKCEADCNNPPDAGSATDGGATVTCKNQAAFEDCVSSASCADFDGGAVFASCAGKCQ